MKHEPVPISEKRLHDFCKIGRGAETCALVVVGGGPSPFHCAVGSVFEPVLRERAAAGQMCACSQNCSGPPEWEPLPGGPVRLDAREQ